MAKSSREGRVAYEAETEALLYDVFIFSTGARCSNQTENDFMRGRGFFLCPIFSVSFPLFLRCCCAVLGFLFRAAVHTASIPKEEKDYPTSGMHVGRRTPSIRPRCESFVASELFSPVAWRQDSWHYQVASLQLLSNMKKLYSIMDLCLLGIVVLCIFPSLASVAGGAGRPRSDSPCTIYQHLGIYFEQSR